MTGWLILMGLALAVIGILWLMRFPAKLGTFLLAALVFGAAGYAWQGSPGLSGAPVSTEPVRQPVDPGLVELRNKLFGELTAERPYFIASDAMMRAGKSGRAVQVMLGAVHNSPRNGSLWAWLGLTMAQHDGAITPPARLAFEKALALWPDHPGPVFFLGLAHIRASDFVEARRWWAKALELTPEGANYREDIAQRLMLLDRLLAQAGVDPETGAAAPTREGGIAPEPPTSAR
ncbi:tetratricopeptide repeat protein [Stakelama tenebrarum]|uniref:Uncharacterized protein n=1 Tax=Stakelama tenebrarum TaxID=2711215 RepID=A0A6G6Y8Q0_9SPHN|nr:hypothetical protein [Sphingosinithalassobacter tenebrarum]QIG80946.1 hypothetical protein G5C33_14890 [Sphingosinithalassobacter tenebrarum]